MTVQECWQLYDAFVCSDADVHLRGSVVNNVSSLNSMMADSVGSNDFDLDRMSARHFEHLDEAGKDVGMDKVQASDSRAANYTNDEDVALVREWQDKSLDMVIGKDQTSANYWRHIQERLRRHIVFARRFESLQIMSAPYAF